MGSIWTIGHSILALDKFVGLLQQQNIKALADVRLFPMSRRYPHFNSEALTKALREEGIRYLHFPELGGRRKPLPDSKNLAWRNESFRGYADYMETAEFKKGIERLIKEASERNVAIMCAEAVWWRCHRGLISDYLKVRGWKVLHIASTGKAEEHPMTSASSIINGQLSYDGAQPGLNLGVH